MITKVVINNNGDTPIEYLSGLGAFRNGKTYEFKPGVNIIVGKNGCGKTTLMNLIRKYLLVDLSECSAGMFNSNINAVCFGLGDDKHMYAGADVYADYWRNTFRLCHAGRGGITTRYSRTTTPSASSSGSGSRQRARVSSWH